MTNEQLYKYVGSNFLNEEIAAYAKDKQKLMMADVSSDYKQVLPSTNSMYVGSDHSYNDKYSSDTVVYNQAYYLMQQKIMDLENQLIRLDSYVEAMDNDFEKLRKKLYDTTDQVQEKVNQMAALVKKFEDIFKQPGCQIVFDNGRIEHPERLIELTL